MCRSAASKRSAFHASAACGPSTTIIIFKLAKAGGTVNSTTRRSPEALARTVGTTMSTESRKSCDIGARAPRWAH